LRHLHRIVAVPFGTNILGLPDIFASIGFIWLIGVLPSSLMIVRVIGLLAGVAALMVFDLWWRLRQPESSRWLRLFSLFTGGCFFFVPIWLLFPLFALGTGVAIILS